MDRHQTGSLSLELMAQAEPGGGAWVHLVPAGTFAGRDGRGPYTLNDPEAVMAASRQAAGRRQIPVDYDHQIDFAVHNGRPAPAAGWITGLQARADGIWGLVEWTARAADHLAQREYRFLSPVFNHTRDGVITRVIRAALTNNPNLDQLTALAAMEGTMEDHLAALRQLLNLAEDADWAAVLAKVGELKDQITARQAAAPDPTAFVPIGDFERAVSEVNRLNQGISLQAATDHVARQIADGKLAPFLREWGVALCTANKPAFDAFLDRTKGVFERITGPSGASIAPPADRASQLTDEETAMCARMGITEKSYLAARAQRESERN
jgi:phage I-like protein